MSDSLSGIGSAPFNVASDIHEQTQARERIEKHLQEQQIEKEHRRVHVREEDMRLEEIDINYDQTGRLQKAQKAQGLIIDREV